MLLGAAAGKPQAAAYVLHVAVECALKVRLLSSNRQRSLAGLRTVMRDEAFSTLFFGKSGHDLSELARIVALERLLRAARNHQLLRRAAWRRMSASDRPYSLRYGVERIARDQALEELEVARAIINQAVPLV